MPPKNRAPIGEADLDLDAIARSFGAAIDKPDSVGAPVLPQVGTTDAAAVVSPHLQVSDLAPAETIKGQATHGDRLVTMTIERAPKRKPGPVKQIEDREGVTIQLAGEVRTMLDMVAGAAEQELLRRYRRRMIVSRSTAARFLLEQALTRVDAAKLSELLVAMVVSQVSKGEQS